MSVMYRPTPADLVLGSAALRRRQATARALARSLSRLQITGLEHVPQHGPVVIAMNHRAFVDGPIVFGFVRRPVTCLVKAEAFTPGLAPLLLGAGQVPVRRDGTDFVAVRQCLRILDGGGVVGVFPEGQRGDGLVETTKGGAAYLAMRSGAPVVPVALHGTELIAHDGLHRPDVQVVIGPALTLPHVPRTIRLGRGQVVAEAERVRVMLADLVKGSLPSVGRAAA